MAAAASWRRHGPKVKSRPAVTGPKVKSKPAQPAAPVVEVLVDKPQPAAPVVEVLVDKPQPADAHGVADVPAWARNMINSQRRQTLAMELEHLAARQAFEAELAKHEREELAKEEVRRRRRMFGKD